MEFRRETLRHRKDRSHERNGSEYRNTEKNAFALPAGSDSVPYLRAENRTHNTGSNFRPRKWNVPLKALKVGTQADCLELGSKSGPETRSSDSTVCGARAVKKRGGRTRVTAGAGSGREEARRSELVPATRGKAWSLDDRESNRNGASDFSGRLHDLGDMHSRMRQHNCFELGGPETACSDSERLVTR